jgi:hypothetical protein
MDVGSLQHQAGQPPDCRALPSTFADTIDRTDAEPAHWTRFWTGHGLSTDQIYYRRTEGADAAAWQDPPDSAVVSGMAVNAIGDLMHGVSVNGDHQFHAAVTTWLAGCFLSAPLTGRLAAARRSG